MVTKNILKGQRIWNALYTKPRIPLVHLHLSGKLFYRLGCTVFIGNILIGMMISNRSGVKNKHQISMAYVFYFVTLTPGTCANEVRYAQLFERKHIYSIC